MRRNLLLVLVVCSFICIGAKASITTEQMTEAEYLINNGYSDSAAEEVLKSKNRAMAQPIEPLYNKSHNGFVRFCRNIYGYIDSSQDTDERLHHDIHQSPHWKDL